MGLLNSIKEIAGIKSQEQIEKERKIQENCIHSFVNPYRCIISCDKNMEGNYNAYSHIGENGDVESYCELCGAVHHEQSKYSPDTSKLFDGITCGEITKSEGNPVVIGTWAIKKIILPKRTNQTLDGKAFSYSFPGMALTQNKIVYPKDSISDFSEFFSASYIGRDYLKRSYSILNEKIGIYGEITIEIHKNENWPISYEPVLYLVDEDGNSTLNSYFDEKALLNHKQHLSGEELALWDIAKNGVTTKMVQDDFGKWKRILVDAHALPYSGIKKIGYTSRSKDKCTEESVYKMFHYCDIDCLKKISIKAKIEEGKSNYWLSNSI